MKVELQAGDIIAIPDGCKAIVKDGSVVFEKEEEEVQEFENGDVLCSVYNSTMLIFKEEYKDHSNRFYTHYNTNHSSNEKWNKDAFRLATEEEKQLLFDKMKERGLLWNAEEKRVEKIKWKAEYGKGYFGIGSQGDLVAYTADGSRFDENLHELGNYFRTKEQAEEAVKRIKEVLRKYHEEIGE